MGMQLVYGFVPQEQSLDKILESRAKELAKRIVLRTSHTMLLEDQQLSPEDVEQSIEEQTQVLLNEMPKLLWD